jgi:TonB family protein
VLPRKVQPPPPPVSFAMVFEAPPDPAPVPIAAAALPAPAAVQVAAPLAASLPRMDIAGTLPRTLPRAHRAPSRPTQAAPVPHDPIPDSKPPAPALARAAQPVPAGNADALAALEARIRQAVADATIYPPAARLLHRQGRSRIRFDYQNGAVSDLAVSRSSEVSSLDEAALSTVRRARMPRPPAEFGDRRLALEVWVNFTLVSDE